MFATAGSPGSWSCGHPVDARDDLRRAARTLAVQDPDGDEVHLLGDAVRRTADRPGDVRAVAVAVVGAPAVDRVEPARRAAAELLVREPDPGVDHVGGHAAPGRRVRVRVVDRQRTLVDAVQPPGRRRLRLGQAHHRVLLHVGDARVAAGSQRLRPRHVGDEPVERRGEHPLHAGSVRALHPGRDEPGRAGRRGSQHDDVATGDRVAVEDQAAGSGGGRGGPPGEQARDQEQDGEGSEMATHRSDPLRS